MNEKSHIRLFKIILAYWPFLLLSTIAAIFFVIFNATSVWITATMINNVLVEFDDMVAENIRLMSSDSLSMNDRIKLYSNEMLLKDSAIATMSSVCLALVIVFSIKNCLLYTSPSPRD